MQSRPRSSAPRSIRSPVLAGVVSGCNSACGVGGCNSIYAWLRIGWPSSNASGWNSIYAWRSGGGDSSNASGCNSSYSRICGGSSIDSQSRKVSGWHIS